MNDLLTWRPRLRPLEFEWMIHEGQQVLVIRDRLGIIEEPLIVPRVVAQLLSFCDGTRVPAAIHAAYQLRTGDVSSRPHIVDVLKQLDDALLFDGQRFEEVCAERLRSYRSGSTRPAHLANRVYPGEPSALLAALDAYGRGLPPVDHVPSAPIRGVVCPHIDYPRGGPVYADTWRRADRAVQDADIVVIFGTDHVGGPGRVTLTRQNYATPLGVLPTALDVVDKLASAIGPDEAYAEEIHHANEHSIELGAVWYHSVRRGDAPPIVPILCGSFHYFTNGDADPSTNERFERMIDALREATAGKKVLAIAAADLAHVGPAFGDPAPLQKNDKEALAVKDASLIETVCQGDAEAFVGQLRTEHDSRRICGLPPIYLMLRFLGDSQGELVRYDQCPADANGGSLVSIGGVLLW